MATTGADARELLVNNASATSLTYSARGVTTRIDSSYGILTQNPVVDAVGFVRQLEYGDQPGAPGQATKATFTPDARFRVQRATIGRWMSNPDSVTRQMLLADNTYTYAAGALTGIKDGRGDEWPKGAKPVSRGMDHDALGQLKNVKYDYGSQSEDSFVPPFQMESEQGLGGYTPFLKAQSRVTSQTFDYDWRGNLTQATDDANVFWDRGFGYANYNNQALADPKPNQLYNASGPAGGSLDVKYDPAGNVVDIVVQRQCTNTGACSHRFRYDWDEAGRLARARRWDFGQKGVDPNWDPYTPTPPDPLADLTFAYDSNDSRVLKTSNISGSTWTDAEIFASLRLDHTTFDGSTNDYDHSATYESVHLAGVGRLIYVPGRDLRVFLELSNHLGSTAVVIDKETGELVERITYLAYGGTESDYRPQKWNSFRDRYRLTGKEEEHDVGLTYFGARYYIAPLGRWASADPLTIHALGADLNPYTYVSGSPLSKTDPRGLSPCPQEDNRGDGGGSGGGGGSDPSPPASPSSPGSGNIASVKIRASYMPCADDAFFEDDSVRFENKPDITEKFMAFDPWANSNFLDRSINSEGGWLNFLQNDRDLENAQNAAAALAIAAGIAATGGMAAGLVGAGVVTVEGAAATVIVNGATAGGLIVDVMAMESGLAVGGLGVAGAAVALEPEIAQIGGGRDLVRKTASALGLGGEVHHAPSWAASRGLSGVTYGNAPSIWMETVDHLLTASHGSGGAGASAYRVLQRDLIHEGRYLDALKMDVDNIRKLFPAGKYDGAIQQMGEYVWRMYQ